MTRSLHFLLLLTILIAGEVHAQALVVPTAPGQTLSLGPDDTRLELQQQRSWSIQAQPGARQVVLHFRARIDAPATIGSCNMIAIDVNGKRVGLKTPRRQTRLLNKPNKFPWTDPPSLDWYMAAGQWRLAYAPDFEILKSMPYYGARAYEFSLDISDLLKPGENTVAFTHTGNKDIARNAKSDLALVFRDLRLEVHEGPGVQPGEPSRPPRFRPFNSGEPRSRELSQNGSGLRFQVRTAGHAYTVTSTIES
ncbi:MAG: hypothetical protein ACM3VW_05635, partial [Bacteroidota bacterium]